jgi:hypothetical protein
MAHLGNAKVVMLGGSGGGGGTTNYNQLSNKPSINGVTLQGNKTTADLSIPVVEANPTGVHAVTPLKVLRITTGGTSAGWKIDPVVANPSDTASTDLTKIKIGDTAYNIPSDSYTAGEGIDIANGVIRNSRRGAFMGRIYGLSAGVGETSVDLDTNETVKDGSLMMMRSTHTGSMSSLKVVYDASETLYYELALKELGTQSAITVNLTDNTILVGIAYPTYQTFIVYGVLSNEVYFEQSVTLSTSTTTTVTFTNSAITSTSVIDIAVSVWGLTPEDVTVSTGVCTIVMPKVSTAQTIAVRIYVR